MSHCQQQQHSVLAGQPQTAASINLGRPAPVRQSSIPMANALLSTVNAARQRQPMCTECEKSLPNQIVFDKIESIIRLMQDEQNGLPVKTAKSFMSKIPSVFTGTDLIQWMMRNLKLEDQQEAVHLANLIASHGYIFPIEDHTLSIKNDCTFYRFQTPCLWPSNNSDPENTDYAVYLCKRTMQGKTRLELADYEAENLARLQKMFSRKWEFIFMQAESQAKVDKKRDKLERKVLDSQERAFWDVYRPVPGCVNTTELDIKKACRLSKSAKRCGECQKVAAAQQGGAGGGSGGGGSYLAPSPEVSFAQDTKPGNSSNSTSSATSMGAKGVQIVEDAEPIGQQHQKKQAAAATNTTTSQLKSSDSREDMNRSPESASCSKAPNADIVWEEKSSSSDNQNLKSTATTTTTTEDLTTVKSVTGSPMAKQPTLSSSSAAAATADTNKSPTLRGDQSKSSAGPVSTRSVAGSHHHHHQHHHHHHHHPHQHGHHHHHHHRQCPHHKHHQAAQASGQAAQQQPAHQAASQQQQSSRDQQLSLPAESILTTTVAASGTWATEAGSAAAETVEKQQQGASGHEISEKIMDKTNEPGKTDKQQAGEQRQLSSKKRSVGSMDHHLARVPSMQTAASRRKSECNRMLSMVETESQAAGGDESGLAVSGNEAAGCRPASACCSHQQSSDNKEQHHHHHHHHHCHHQQQAAASASGQQQACKQQAGSSPKPHRSVSNQSNQQQQMLRKSSLDILRPSDDQSQVGSSSAANAPGSASTSASVRKTSVHLQGQHSPLKSTQSVATGSSASGATAGGEGGDSSQKSSAAGVSVVPTYSGAANSSDRQNIDDLERELESLKVRLDRRIGGVKMSKVTQSYLSYFKQWAEYDPFIAQPIPSNPWISDSTELWDSERQTKDVHCRRVRRWAFSLKELLNDPAGREQFHRFLEKEFSAENLKFWDAVQELKRVHSRDVARRVEAIWTEYLAQDANCPINIDSKSYETSKKNMAKNKNNRYIFDEAAGHVYQLMKNDSYPRYLRSDMYKDYKEASEKKRTNQVAFDVFKPQITTLKHKFNF